MSFIGSHKKTVIISLIVIVLLAGGGAAYFFINQYITSLESTTETSDTTVVQKHQASLKTAQEKVETLVEVGDKASIKEAEAVINAQITAAEESNDEAYVATASIAKATFLLSSGQPQEALDMLKELEKEYDGNEDYIYEVYGLTSWAYRDLAQPDKEAEYFDKLPGGEGEL